MCGARRQPAELLEQAEFVEHVGRENLVPHVEAALERARELMSRFSGVGDEAAEDLRRASM
jgi:SulP family sulfate permease